MPYILADTGYLYALFDARDSYNALAREKAIFLEMASVLIPWPVLYETLGTRFVRNRRALALFQDYLKRPGVTFLDDTPYREAAINDLLALSFSASRHLSLVDCVLRLIIVDPNVRLDAVATFNTADFADVCRRRRVELI